MIALAVLLLADNTASEPANQETSGHGAQNNLGTTAKPSVMDLGLFRALDTDPFFGRSLFGRWPALSAPHFGGDGLTTHHSHPLGAVDVKETDAELTFHVDAPGLTQDDIKVQLTGDVLSISGKRAEDKDEDTEERGVKWHRKERRSFSFSRQFTLPAHIDAAALAAHFDDGVLSVTVPKLPEKAPGIVNVPVGSKKSGATGREEL